MWKEWGLGNLRKAVGLGSDRGTVGKRDPEEVATGRRKRKSHLKRKREF